MRSGLLQSIDQQTQLAGHNRLALLLFRLGGCQLFGINVFKVQEALVRPTITVLPDAHPMVAGVSHVRGQTVPMLDLARAINPTQHAASDKRYAILTEYNRSVQGFLVHAVDRIIHVAVETVLPPPAGAGEHSYLTAITRNGEELVQILDVEQVLTEVLGAPSEISPELRRTPKVGVTRPRVLVADDSRIARSQVQRILDQIGAEAVLVNDGREALHYLQGLADRGGPVHRELAMVISDIEMPDMDGYTLTTEIRRDPRLRDLYVILHTSLSGVFNNALIEKVAANRFVAKFAPDELARAVLERLEIFSKQ